MIDSENFMITDFSLDYGLSEEKQVWDKIQLIFKQRTCLVYWRYPVFS